MPLGPGSTVGPYEITATLGAGGMGEVFRARDRRLNRDVALKTLPERFVADPDRRARLEVEARALAALNHPHIGAIYGLEDSSNPPALVLELVEGDTLEARIARGRLPVRDALVIARQIAEAVEAAHAKEVIHRDLKPSNVKITPEGVVKVLDFGLAKLIERPAAPASADGDAMATVTSPAVMTGAGVILGTAAYASPEQARGLPADRRADIWAFGCVLFELLSGRAPFRGADVADTVAFVLAREPDWQTLPSDTPPSIVTLLKRCLRKDRSRRLADIADARIEIDDALEAPASAPATVGVASRARSSASRWAVITLVAALAGAGIAWGLRPAGAVAEPERYPSVLGADATLPAMQEGSSRVVPSPDGRLIAFVAVPRGASTTQIFRRKRDEKNASPLQGTEGAGSIYFDPSSQWIAFTRPGQLLKISVSGGAAVPLATTTGPPGGVAWTSDGRIIFQPSAAGGPLLQIPDSGSSTPTPVTMLMDDEVSHRWPHVLPGNSALLFTVISSGNRPSLIVQSLTSGERRVVHPAGTYGRYVSSGHIVFAQEATLFAMPFDLESLTPLGPAEPIIAGVMSGSLSHGAQFAVSDTGTLAYLESADGAGQPLRRLYWLYRDKLVPFSHAPVAWGTPRFSPDGNRLALTVLSPSADPDIWVYDVTLEVMTPVEQQRGSDAMPVWTPHGGGLVYGSTQHAGAQNLYWRRADGLGEAKRLTKSDRAQLPRSIRRLPNGEVWLAYHEGLPPRQDSVFVRLEGDERTGWRVVGERRVIPGGNYRNVFATLSPDGRWVMYLSDKSGEIRLYVQPFPALDDEVAISPGAANDPVWSEKRSELFYSTLAPTPGAQARIMRVEYDGRGAEFRVLNRPSVWSDQQILLPPASTTFGGSTDLHPDGTRFVVAAAGDATEPAPPSDRFEVVLNFFELLRQRAPVP
jgi:hypothetical protein